MLVTGAMGTPTAVGEGAAAAGDDDDAPPRHKELGLLFLSEAGARALADKVRKEAPRKMARDVSVARTTLDRVFALATAAARPAGAEHVAFRFVPDAAQVERATTVTDDATSKQAGGGFIGVPVFQAAGLSVNSSAKKYTPLFLDAADLDEAVRSAVVARDAAAAAAEAEAAGAALRAAEAAAEAATDKRKAAAEAALEVARARAAAAAAPPITRGGGALPHRGGGVLGSCPWRNGGRRRGWPLVGGHAGAAGRVGGAGGGGGGGQGQEKVRGERG